MVSNVTELTKAMGSYADDTLIRLVYVSNISKQGKSDPDLFNHIRSHAENYNRKNNIKGMLCNNQTYFLQCLEGTKQVLLPLMERIFRDKRHKNLQVTLLKPIDNFNFYDWRMRSLNLDERLWLKDSIQCNAKHLKEFVPFKPLQWSEWFLEYFLEAMKQFDSTEVNQADDLGSYDLIKDDNLRLTNFLDSTMLHRLLLAMVALVLVGLLRVNAII